MAETVAGLYKPQKKGPGELRDPARLSPKRLPKVTVPQKLAQTHHLVEGALVEGRAERGKRGFELSKIDSIGGIAPEAFAHRVPQKDLVAIDPCERFRVGDSGEPAMRVVELVAPFGKGTRSLIVSPPKAGKTMMLEQIARAIRETEPETRIVALLIDERPEEVTHFRRAVDAEVVASSSDQTAREHVELSELMLAHIRTELECGRDVVVLLDSLTRMGRAFNLRTGGRGRTMSGGVEAGALEIPRRFFGLARNIEDGGSVTIVGTVLVDTGSRMDQVIFEEFKGTGNSEIILSRELAESRTWPAIDIAASGTRKEALLYDPERAQRINALRRGLAGTRPDQAMQKLLKLIDQHPTNDDLLDSLPKVS